jgi:hypothetical protein
MLTYKLTGTTEASGSTAANNNSVHPPPARSPAVIRPNLHAPRCANGAAMLTCGNAVLAEVRDVRLSSFKTVERQTPSASATCGLHFDGGATTTRRQQSARRGRKPFEVERPKAPLVTVLPDVQLECPPDPHRSTGQTTDSGGTPQRLSRGPSKATPASAARSPRCSADQPPRTQAAWPSDPVRAQAVMLTDQLPERQRGAGYLR